MLVYQELCIDTCAFGVNGESALARKKKIRPQDLKDVRVLCGTYEYMEASFEEMLKDTGAKMQDLHTEYNLESMVQAKFQESLGKLLFPYFESAALPHHSRKCWCGNAKRRRKKTGRPGK